METAKVARLQDSAASQNKSAGVLHAQIEKSMKEIFDLQAAEHEAGVKRDWDMEVYDKAAGSHIQVVEASLGGASRAPGRFRLGVDGGGSSGSDENWCRRRRVVPTIRTCLTAGQSARNAIEQRPDGGVARHAGLC